MQTPIIRSGHEFISPEKERVLSKLREQELLISSQSAAIESMLGRLSSDGNGDETRRSHAAIATEPSYHRSPDATVEYRRSINEMRYSTPVREGEIIGRLRNGDSDGMDDCSSDSVEKLKKALLDDIHLLSSSSSPEKLSFLFQNSNRSKRYNVANSAATFLSKSRSALDSSSSSDTAGYRGAETDTDIDRQFTASRTTDDPVFAAQQRLQQLRDSRSMHARHRMEAAADALDQMEIARLKAIDEARRLSALQQAQLFFAKQRGKYAFSAMRRLVLRRNRQSGKQAIFAQWRFHCSFLTFVDNSTCAAKAHKCATAYLLVKAWQLFQNGVFLRAQYRLKELDNNMLVYRYRLHRHCRTVLRFLRFKRIIRKVRLLRVLRFRDIFWSKRALRRLGKYRLGMKSIEVTAARYLSRKTEHRLHSVFEALRWRLELKRKKCDSFCSQRQLAVAINRLYDRSGRRQAERQRIEDAKCFAAFYPVKQAIRNWHFYANEKGRQRYLAGEGLHIYSERAVTPSIVGNYFRFWMVMAILNKKEKYLKRQRLERNAVQLLDRWKQNALVRNVQGTRLVRLIRRYLLSRGIRKLLQFKSGCGSTSRHYNLIQTAKMFNKKMCLGQARKFFFQELKKRVSIRNRMSGAYFAVSTLVGRRALRHWHRFRFLQREGREVSAQESAARADRFRKNAALDKWIEFALRVYRLRAGNRKKQQQQQSVVSLIPGRVRLQTCMARWMDHVVHGHEKKVSLQHSVLHYHRTLLSWSIRSFMNKIEEFKSETRLIQSYRLNVLIPLLQRRWFASIRAMIQERQGRRSDARLLYHDKRNLCVGLQWLVDVVLQKRAAKNAGVKAVRSHSTYKLLKGLSLWRHRTYYHLNAQRSSIKRALAVRGVKGLLSSLQHLQQHMKRRRFARRATAQGQLHTIRRGWRHFAVSCKRLRKDKIAGSENIDSASRLFTVFGYLRAWNMLHWQYRVRSTKRGNNRAALQHRKNRVLRQCFAAILSESESTNHLYQVAKAYSDGQLIAISIKAWQRYIVRRHCPIVRIAAESGGDGDAVNTSAILRQSIGGRSGLIGTRSSDRGSVQRLVTMTIEEAKVEEETWNRRIDHQMAVRKYTRGLGNFIQFLKATRTERELLQKAEQGMMGYHIYLSWSRWCSFHKERLLAADDHYHVQAHMDTFFKRGVFPQLAHRVLSAKLLRFCDRARRKATRVHALANWKKIAYIEPRRKKRRTAAAMGSDDTSCIHGTGIEVSVAAAVAAAAAAAEARQPMAGTLSHEVVVQETADILNVISRSRTVDRADVISVAKSLGVDRERSMERRVQEQQSQSQSGGSHRSAALIPEDDLFLSVADFNSTSGGSVMSTGTGTGRMTADDLQQMRSTFPQRSVSFGASSFGASNEASAAAAWSSPVARARSGSSINSSGNRSSTPSPSKSPSKSPSFSTTKRGVNSPPPRHNNNHNNTNNKAGPTITSPAGGPAGRPAAQMHDYSSGFIDRASSLEKHAFHLSRSSPHRKLKQQLTPIPENLKALVVKNKTGAVLPYGTTSIAEMGQPSSGLSSVQSVQNRVAKLRRCFFDTALDTQRIDFRRLAQQQRCTQADGYFEWVLYSSYLHSWVRHTFRTQHRRRVVRFMQRKSFRKQFRQMRSFAISSKKSHTLMRQCAEIGEIKAKKGALSLLKECRRLSQSGRGIELSRVRKVFGHWHTLITNRSSAAHAFRLIHDIRCKHALVAAFRDWASYSHLESILDHHHTHTRLNDFRHALAHWKWHTSYNRRYRAIADRGGIHFLHKVQKTFIVAITARLYRAYDRNNSWASARSYYEKYTLRAVLDNLHHLKRLRTARRLHFRRVGRIFLLQIRKAQALKRYRNGLLKKADTQLTGSVFYRWLKKTKVSRWNAANILRKLDGTCLRGDIRNPRSVLLRMKQPNLHWQYRMHVLIRRLFGLSKKSNRARRRVAKCEDHFLRRSAYVAFRRLLSNVRRKHKRNRISSECNKLIQIIQLRRAVSKLDLLGTSKWARHEENRLLGISSTAKAMRQTLKHLHCFAMASKKEARKEYSANYNHSYSHSHSGEHGISRNSNHSKTSEDSSPTPGKVSLSNTAEGFQSSQETKSPGGGNGAAAGGSSASSMNVHSSFSRAARSRSKSPDTIPRHGSSYPAFHVLAATDGRGGAGISGWSGEVDMYAATSATTIPHVMDRYNYNTTNNSDLGDLSRIYSSDEEEKKG